jgi:hypothetical protein
MRAKDKYNFNIAKAEDDLNDAIVNAMDNGMSIDAVCSNLGRSKQEITRRINLAQGRPIDS